ncbi:MAG: NYN domain-containing protein [Candidatus Aenigmarchaeota archaeon]|nr:NYN domain-containing protein [Candidatus Aenigmarchaeota archaeon]
MDSKERVCIFIDGSNFYHSVKDTFNLHDSQIDFAKLIGILRKDRLLIGTYYYNASLDIKYNKEIYWKQQKFFADLRKIPALHIILAHMRKTEQGGKVHYSVKGDDIHLAIDMVSFAYENLYDTAILVSGDGDFEPAIKRVQKLGKKVENAYFIISRSSLLKQVSNTSIILDDIISKYMKSDDKKDK